MSVENQNIVHIMPRDFTDGKSAPFGRYHRVDSARAMRTLSHVGFKLWFALCMNKDNFDLELSQAALQKEFGIKKTSYYNAIAELESNGYLHKIKAGSNIYRFYETPVCQLENAE